jgi:N-acetylneuraminic acid mutarotase
MKKFSANQSSFAFALILFCTSISFSQNYTWIKGSSNIDKSGIYGSKGISSSSNNPGSREGAMSWKDNSGNFWLFGGLGFDAVGTYDMLNDLWKYSFQTNEWIWIGGDILADKVGIYGTQGMASSNNKPGARIFGSTWADASGNLWLFGGVGNGTVNNQDLLNDVWKYNISTGQWTWVKGSSSTMQTANYGTLNVSNNSNRPGARLGACNWIDASGNFWMFGGYGVANNTLTGSLSDLWKYNSVTNQWVWINGNNLIDQNGVYGTLGVASTSNKPGSRAGANAWADNAGNIWMFGGNGFDATSAADDILSDLWKFNINNNQWTWIHGSNSQLNNGIYGTLGQPSASNRPGARYSASNWIDDNGNFWLFGGNGLDESSAFSDNLNDLWKYHVSSNQWSWQKGSKTVNQVGVYGTQGIASASNTPGARLAGNAWKDNLGNLWLFGGSGVPNSGIGTQGDLNDLWKLNLCSNVVVINPSTNLICKGESTVLSATGASSYTWSNFTSSTTSSITVSPSVTTNYYLNTTDATGCKNSASITVNVSACSSYFLIQLMENLF